MPREIISVGAGQCGNQLSASFWERLCLEHGIQEDGTLRGTTPIRDRKDVFFYQSDDSRYIPRAVLLDLEPRVVQNVVASSYGNIYNPENVFFPEHGSGAGNNWGEGYTQGEAVMETMLDILEREAENSDSLEAFMLMHSVAGGTGSGLGSSLLEHMRDRFPKTLLQTTSIFPSSGPQASDVVVQPYNSVLALRWLVEHADSVLMFDNNALMRIANDTMHLNRSTQQPVMADCVLNGNSRDSTALMYTNSLVSTALLTATATIRFPGYLYNTWSSVLASLIPLPTFHFLTASYTPFLSMDQSNEQRFVRKTTVSETMRRLVQPKYSLLSVSPQAAKNSKYIAMLRVMQGEFDAADYRKRLLGLREQDSIRFAPVFVESVQLAVAKRSPLVNYSTKLNGLGLINSTAVSETFRRTLLQFNRLYSRGAFLNEYRKQDIFGENLREFETARDVLANLIEQYKSLETGEADDANTEI